MRDLDLAIMMGGPQLQAHAHRMMEHLQAMDKLQPIGAQAKGKLQTDWALTAGDGSPFIRTVFFP